MRRKIVAIWLSLLIMVSSIVILVEIADRVEAPTTRYVGGTGGGNYTKIQWAIDNASDGDTVYVYNGTYNENVVIDKTISLIGEDKENTTINGSNSGSVVRFAAHWVNVSHFTIINSGPNQFDAGFQLDSSNNRITENNIYSNNEGIYLINADGNSILGNNISNNSGNGIFCISSRNNNIADNIVSENNKNGILIRESQDITVSNNTIFANNWQGIYNYISMFSIITNNQLLNDGLIVGGSNLTHFNSQIIPNNNSVNGKPLLYIKNTDNIIIDGEAVGQVILVNCQDSMVENLQINNTDAAIELGYSSNITVIGNNLWNNRFCVYILRSSNNYIIANNISSNTYGLYFSVTSNNRIYNNNIINNNIQAGDITPDNIWNNSYPSGGNYWSDYTGVDNKKGVNQDIPGSDGIGDTPYDINGISEDKYPLMDVFVLPENYSILRQGWNLISIPLIQEEQNISTVFSSIDGWYDAVQWYNITDLNKPWKHNKIGKSFGNDLSELNETMSFWIHITQPGDTIFVYNGTKPIVNQTIQLHKGWNMVGYPSLSSHNRTVGMNGLDFGSDVDCIQWYDAATQTWHFMDSNDYFIPGRGYWVHSRVDTSWEVPL